MLLVGKIPTAHRDIYLSIDIDHLHTLFRLPTRMLKRCSFFQVLHQRQAMLALLRLNDVPDEMKPYPLDFSGNHVS